MISHRATELSRPKRALPAWLMSAVAHFVLVLVVSFAWRPSLPAAPGEPSREVGIVLARRQSPNQVDYFDPADNAAETDAAVDSTNAETATDANAATAASSLPAAGAAADLPLPDIDLPGVDLPGGSGDDLLVHSVDVRGAGRQPILPGVGDAEIMADEAARRAAKAALGPATRLSVFGSAEATGRSFVFAIDRSKSMGGDGLNALAAARDELTRVLADLESNHRFQVLAYHHGCVYCNTPRLVPATKENKAKVSPFIDGLAAFGGTVHEMALRAALAMEPDVVFLLTDGGDPHLNEIQRKNIKKLADGLATIHCIQFGYRSPSDGAEFMKKLAQDNGGSYVFVDMSLAKRKPGI